MAYVALGFPAEDPVIETPTTTTLKVVETISEGENQHWPTNSTDPCCGSE